MDILTAIIAFIVALGLLVTFHEYGHYIVARKLGIKVLRFSVGFGKPLFRRTSKSGVEFVVAAIPLGGYVKMLDEREGPVPKEQLSLAFNRQSLLARTLVVLAGPVFNFIFAIFAFWLMFVIGTLGFAPIIGKVAPGSPAALSQVKPMMEVVEVSNTPTMTWQQVVNAILPSLGDESFTMRLKETHSNLDQSTFHDVVIQVDDWTLDQKQPDILGSLGITPFRPEIPAIIGDVIRGEPADVAGMEVGDKIIAVNGRPIEHWNDFVTQIHPMANQLIQITVVRDGQQLELDVQLSHMDSQGKQLGYLGVVIKPIELSKEFVRHERFGPIESIGKALSKTWDLVALTLSLLGKMLTGKIGLETISGPITIAQGAGATASIGIAYYLGFLALISVSLGVINLLPIPVLDGGHLVFYAIEAVLRRPPSDKFIQASYHVGILMILGLMVLAFYNDIVRLI